MCKHIWSRKTLNTPSQQNKKRAVIYCRVSTKEQVEEGNSLSTQQKICTEYCLKNGYDIAGIFIEQGESAKTADRTELKKLLTFCAGKKNQISAIVIYKIDRLSRNTDDYSQLRLLLKRYGVEIRSTSEHFEDTPVGRFMENTMANIAQFDNDIRTERSVGGMREAMREGRYIWRAPLGYNNVKVNGRATIAPDALTFPLVKQTFLLIAQNKYPTEEVRKMMQAHGLVTRNGKPVSQSFFYHALNSEIYTGWITMFGERHKGTFEPLVSEELFTQVQRVLKKKGKRGIIHITDNPDFPLRRFVKNPTGRKLTGSWSQGRNRKYPFYRFGGEGSNFARDPFEKRFTKFMDKFKFSEDHIELLERLVYKHFDKALSGNIKEVERLKRQVEKLKNKQTVLLDKNLEGIISDQVLKVQMDIIETDLMNANAMLSRISERDADPAGLTAFVKEYLKRPSKIWLKASPAVKIKLQWFEFPSGIILENNLFRTAEIVNVFKLKSLFSDYLSYKGDFDVKISNTKKIPREEAINNIRLEIKTLSEIFKEEKNKNDEIS